MEDEEMMLCRGGGYSCYRRVEGNKDPLPSQDMKSSLSSCLAVLGSQSKLTTCPEGVPKRPLKILEKCPDCGGFSVLVAPASMNLSHNQPNSIHPIQCRTALKLQWSASYTFPSLHRTTNRSPYSSPSPSPSPFPLPLAPAFASCLPTRSTNCSFEFSV